MCMDTACTLTYTGKWGVVTAMGRSLVILVLGVDNVVCMCST